MRKKKEQKKELNEGGRGQRETPNVLLRGRERCLTKKKIRRGKDRFKAGKRVRKITEEERPRVGKKGGKSNSSK